MKPSTDVLVVGAGPTGLTLAAALATQGKRVTIIDRQAEGANTSRGAVVHARTLELLEQIGVADRLTARGLKVGTFSVRDRDRTLLSVDFTHLQTRYPYTLMVSQAVTESVLLKRLNEAGVDVLRPRTLAVLMQDREGAAICSTIVLGCVRGMLSARTACTAKCGNWQGSGFPETVTHSLSFVPMSA